MNNVFIGYFPFTKGAIEVVKSTTGHSSHCIYPYDALGKPLTEEQFKAQYPEAYAYMLEHKSQLVKRNMPDAEKNWYLFARSQGIGDVFKEKYTVNNIVKTFSDIRMKIAMRGQGVYGGLYILSGGKFSVEISKALHDKAFRMYVRALGKYKSGGYYTFNADDLQRYLNYALSEKFKKI